MAFRLESSQGAVGESRIGATLSEINIIPLVDVILVLLLIFMLTAPLMHRGIDVNLPRSAGKPTAVEERMVLTLTKDQTVFLNDKPVPVSQLDARLRDLMKDRSDKTLYLKADQGLQYGFVVETMDRLRRAGVEKLGMVTEPARPR
jgi:biopolymer transport protein TolR